MATNINTELFKRYAPKKKLDIIESLSPSELLATTPATITRIIKEAGENRYKSRDKRLFISRDRQRGNSWNSTVEAVELLKGKVYIDVYVQYENTDTNTDYPLSSFLGRGESRVEINRDDRYGNPRTYYSHYDEGSKARVIKSILHQYVYNKYEDKLRKEEAA